MRLYFVNPIIQPCYPTLVYESATWYNSSENKVRIKGGSATPKNPSFDQVIDEKVEGVDFMDLNAVIVLMRFLVAAASLFVALPKAVRYIRRVIRRIKK